MVMAEIVRSTRGLALPGRIGLVVHHALHRLDRGFASERVHPGEDLVEHHPEREDIGLAVRLGGVARGLLGRHVGRRAHHRTEAGSLGVGLVAVVVLDQLLRQPPVHDVDDPEVVDHDVFGFEIAVDHALVVGGGHRFADATEKPTNRARLLRSRRSSGMRSFISSPRVFPRTFFMA